MTDEIPNLSGEAERTENRYPFGTGWYSKANKAEEESGEPAFDSAFDSWNPGVWAFPVTTC